MSLQKWWLLSDKDLGAIIFALTAAIQQCPDADSRKPLEDALHILESGLHITDAVPGDFKEVKRSP
jgi:hypothetical protein